MQLEDVIINFVDMDSTEALRQYALEKLGKYEQVIEKATRIEIFLKQRVAHRGAKADFVLDINVSVPNALIRVEERGNDMYQLIDSSTDVLNKRFRRYQDKLENWEGITPWKEIEMEANGFEEEYEDEPDNYINYEPVISKRESFNGGAPMEEAEAIEQMELTGENQIAFRNKRTNGPAVIYRRRSGGYGIIEFQ